MYRVYDDRTDKTLYTAELAHQCGHYIEDNYDEGDGDWDCIWIERIKDVKWNLNFISF